MHAPREVASFSDDRFASYERRKDRIDSFYAIPMAAFTPV
jgi:hypothetical protein